MQVITTFVVKAESFKDMLKLKITFCVYKFSVQRQMMYFKMLRTDVKTDKVVYGCQSHLVLELVQVSTEWLMVLPFSASLLVQDQNQTNHHHLHSLLLQPKSQSYKPYVVVVYNVTIVAIGHVLLKKFWPMVIGCVLRTAGSSII